MVDLVKAVERCEEFVMEYGEPERLPPGRPRSRTNPAFGR